MFQFFKSFCYNSQDTAKQLWRNLPVCILSLWSLANHWASLWFIGWVVPPPNSHHQDYETFLVGNPNLNLHFHYYWEGGTTKFIGHLSWLRFPCWPNFSGSDLRGGRSNAVWSPVSEAIDLNQRPIEPVVGLSGGNVQWSWWVWRIMMDL